MSKKFLAKTLESLMQNNDTDAAKFLGEYFKSKSQVVLAEDHEKYMTSAQMEKYLKKLFKKAKKEHHEEFAKLLNITKCNDENLATCAKVLANNKKKADKVIHKLEKLVNTKMDPKTKKVIKENRFGRYGHDMTRDDDFAYDGMGDDWRNEDMDLDDEDMRNVDPKHWPIFDASERLNRKQLEQLLAQYAGITEFKPRETDDHLRALVFSAYLEGTIPAKVILSLSN